MVDQILKISVSARSDHAFQNDALMENLLEIRDLSSRQYVSQQSIDDLVAAVGSLEQGQRKTFVDQLETFVEGTNASLFASLLFELIKSRFG